MWNNPLVYKAEQVKKYVCKNISIWQYKKITASFCISIADYFCRSFLMVCVACLISAFSTFAPSSSVVRVFAHGAMGRRIDPSWGGTHWATSRSSQCSTTWCNKGCGMCYPVCGMMHIKEPLLLIRKSSPCGGSGFPLSLSEWSIICPTPYNRKIKCVECVVK